MRRLRGLYDGIAYAIVAYADGQVECPPVLAGVLQHEDGSLPTGVELDQVCRLLFGPTLVVEEDA